MINNQTLITSTKEHARFGRNFQGMETVTASKLDKTKWESISIVPIRSFQNPGGSFEIVKQQGSRKAREHEKINL
jgi:hypothetical protein